jgi:hypothetical protein
MLHHSQRVASARLTSIAAACVQVHRLDHDQALAEIAEVLAEYTPDVRAAILANATSIHVDGHRRHDRATTDLFVAAGADLDEARRIRIKRHARGHWRQMVAGRANRRKPAG